MPKPATLPLWATNGGTTVEPLLAEKQAGWPNSFRPPARWFNWWMNLVYQWAVWLNDYEATAHTWTAKQTFNDAIEVNDAGSGVDGAVKATGTGNKAGFYGVGGSSAGSYGVRGIGASTANQGRNGTSGEGGTGSTFGGLGVFGIGGTSSAGAGGVGGTFIGATIDGATNTAGAPGVGSTSTGGAITSDANGRRGGDGHRSTAGLGQNGLGCAYKAVKGDIEINEGGIVQTGNDGHVNVLLDTQVSGPLEVLGASLLNTLDVSGLATLTAALNVTGLITANGGIALPAITTPALNSPFGTSVTVGYWKNAFGETSLRGAVSTGGASNGAVLFTLPVGFRPTQTGTWVAIGDGAGRNFYVSVLLNGNVVISWDSLATLPAVVPLDSVRFRNS